MHCLSVPSKLVKSACETESKGGGCKEVTKPVYLGEYAAAPKHARHPQISPIPWYGAETGLSRPRAHD